MSKGGQQNHYGVHEHVAYTVVQMRGYWGVTVARNMIPSGVIAISRSLYNPPTAFLKLFLLMASRPAMASGELLSFRGSSP